MIIPAIAPPPSPPPVDELPETNENTVKWLEIIELFLNDNPFELHPNPAPPLYVVIKTGVTSVKLVEAPQAIVKEVLVVELKFTFVLSVVYKLTSQ
jgi:hypothetical protein